MSMRDSSVIGYDVLSTLNTLAIPETVYPVTGFANDYRLSLTSGAGRAAPGAFSASSQALRSIKQQLNSARVLRVILISATLLDLSIGGYSVPGSRCGS